MANYDIILWDWNGTLIDDVKQSVESITPSLIKRNLYVPTIDEYRKLFRFPVIDYYKDLGFDFDKEPFNMVANEYTNLYATKKYEPNLFKEVKEVLAVLKSKGLRQYILTASEKSIVEESLAHYNIAKYFESVAGCDNTLAHGKIDIGKNLIAKNNLHGKILMIGDTVHDYEVAKSLKIDCVLITGGHNLKENLIKTGIPVLDNRYQLYRIIFPELYKKEPIKDINGSNIEINKDAFEDDVKRFSEINDFSTKYKAFYDDIKMTNKTEDW